MPFDCLSEKIHIYDTYQLNTNYIFMPYFLQLSEVKNRKPNQVHGNHFNINIGMSDWKVGVEVDVTVVYRMFQ